jgi:tetratricopeptide (TPR) repeat protein
VPKITDFGLAKLLDGSAGENTRSGVVVGTPNYMAPEQALGRNQDVGPGTDVYALGVLLYQALTGRQPFRGETAMDVLLAVTNTEPVPPARLQPKVPRDLDTICLKCLEKQPRQRYASAAELAEDLRRFLHHEPILARPVRLWGRGLRWARRRPTTAALLAVTAAVLLGLLGTVAAYARAEQRRAQRSRVEAHDLILRGREAVSHEAWEDARNLLRAARRRIDAEADLADLRPEADELLGTAEGQLAARAAFRAFGERHDEALFLATLASSAGTAEHLRGVRDKVSQALALTDSADGEGGPGPYFSEREKQELRRGRYELLLMLAEAVAQPLPQQAPAERARQAEEALAVLARAPALGLKAPAYHLQRARYLAQKGDEAGARGERRRAEQAAARTAFDHYLIGTEHYRQGDAGRAVPALLAALQLQPGHFWARYFLALSYVRLQQPTPARVLLTSCLEQRPGVVWIYLVRGFVQGQLGEHDGAEADFQASLDLLKGRPDRAASYVLYNNRAVARIGRQRYAEAEQDLRRAIALRPAQYQAYATLAHVQQQQQKKLPEAAAALGQALAAARRLVEGQEADAQTLVLLYRQRARVQAARADLEAALRDLGAALVLDEPGAGRARTGRERGHLLYRLGRHEQALACYATALADQPGDAESWRWHGQALLKLNRPDEAARSFDRYLRAGGKPNAQVYHCRALARLKQGDHQAALSDFTLALGQGPGDATLWAQRGQSYLACQAAQLDLRDFEEAIRLDARNGLAHLGRGLARLQLGQRREADDDAESAVRLAPGNARLTYDAACLLAQVAGQLGGGPASTRQAREARRGYQERSVQLLRQALLLLPAEQRAGFWNETARGDHSLGPVRAHAGFTQLERLYGRRPVP